MLLEGREHPVLSVVIRTQWDSVYQAKKMWKGISFACLQNSFEFLKLTSPPRRARGAANLLSDGGEKK